MAPMIQAIQEYTNHLIVTDGNSTDNTRDIAKNLGVNVLHGTGPGKGIGMQRAVAYAAQNQYSFICFLDCDQTYPVDAIPELASYCEKADLIIGARNFMQIAFLRRLANRVMNATFNLVFNSKQQDIASGMMLLKVNCFKNKLTAQRFDIEAQIRSIAVREKMRIVEVPISYSKREGESKIRIFDLFIILRRIFRERYFS